MEHTKKFVLVDPRFVRPSMREKALSGLDTEISSILNSDVSDEIKARSYISALTRYKNYSAPPRSEETQPTTPHPPPLPPTVPPSPTVPAVPAAPSVFSLASKTASPRKGSRKRAKTESLDIASSLDPLLWRRTQRSRVTKKFGSQWIEYNGRSKKKSRAAWIES